ncbi:MAG: hemolysin family protein [Bacteroides sp.]|nr:hemolysin family protein [Prevotella sp.]MCM1407653.1 hemolysin family protein [Treponema brennaborense]MCM1469197.1 hemolysin family protein [Bacteroides sp.]
MNSEEPPPAQFQHITGLLILAAVLLVLSMIFSASESAFLSINKLRIRFLRNKKDKRAVRAGKLLDNREKLLNTLLVANNIVNITLSAVLTSLALEIFGAAGVGLAAAAVTILLLVFGEITPKTIGSHHPEQIAFAATGIVRFFEIVLAPFVFAFSAVSRLLVRAAGISLTNPEVSFTEDDIKSFIDTGEEEGILESGETSMMHRVFKFSDLAAKDIMIPRTEITAVSLHAGYREIIELSQKTHLSHLPVFEKNIDDIKGVLYMKDVLFYAGNPLDFSVKDVMRPPLFILETKKMSSIQQMLRENRQSIAIVLDEYSETSGLLTREDIAQEIFGVMYDEYDTAAVSGIAAIEADANEAVVLGSTRLMDINEKMQIQLESDFYDTIAGYITEKMDCIPKQGAVFTADGCVFTILDATDRRILRVSVQKTGQTGAAN